MQRIIERALTETAELWEPLRRAYRWVRAAAHVLANPDKQGRTTVTRDFVRVLRSIGVTKRHCGPLEAALTHFLKVTRNYRAGLFHCYDDPSIPRTNNDLEQYFGRASLPRATRDRTKARISDYRPAWTRAPGRECDDPPTAIYSCGACAARS
jgi:hypothetical protein